MTFLNIGKYLVLTAIFPFIFLKSSYAVLKGNIKCDPNDEIAYIANLDNWERNLMPVGAKLKISCLPGYGFTKNDKIYSSFEVTCGENGKITGYHGISCQRACSEAEALKLNNKVNPNATVMKSGKETSISSSQLVENNDTIKIMCLAGHFLKGDDGQITNENFYLYKCSNNPNAASAVKKCKMPDVVFSPIKPSSTSNGTIMRLCDLMSLQGVANAKITEADNEGKTPTLQPSKEATLSCIKEFTALYKGKISEKFKVTCDPKGTGRFVIYNAAATTDETKYAPLAACTKRCNIDELAKKSSRKKGSSVDEDSTPSVQFLHPSENQNSSDNLYKYANINEKVRVTCPSEYAIRSTNLQTYEAVCLASGFDNIQVCEPLVKPCNNSELEIEDESIVYSPNDTVPVVSQKASGTTWVGSVVDLACQGGNDLYFLKNGGQNNIPRCIYKEREGVSEWDRKTFRCFDGCINANGSRKVRTEKADVEVSRTLTRLFTKCENQTSKIDGTDWQIGPYCPPPSNDYLKNVMPGLTESEGIPILPISDSAGGSEFQVAFFVREKAKVFRCASRQTALQESTILLGSLHFAKMQKDSGPSNFMFYNEWAAGSCLDKNYVTEQQGSVCESSLKSHYEINNFQGNQGKSSPSNLTNKNFPGGSCPELYRDLLAQNIFKAGFSGRFCKGAGQVHNCAACSCANQFNSISKITVTHASCSQGNQEQILINSDTYSEKFDVN